MTQDTTWLILSPRNVGKSVFIKSRRSVEITGVPRKVEVFHRQTGVRIAEIADQPGAKMLHWCCLKDDIKDELAELPECHNIKAIVLVLSAKCHHVRYRGLKGPKKGKFRYDPPLTKDDWLEHLEVLTGLLQSKGIPYLIVNAMNKKHEVLSLDQAKELVHKNERG